MKTLSLLLLSMLISIPLFSQSQDKIDYEKGIEAYMEQDFKSAVEYFSKTNQANPNNIKVLIMLCRSYINNGDYQEALSCANQAEALSKKDALQLTEDIYSAQAVIYQRLDSSEMAISKASDAILVNPKDGYMYNVRGFEYYKLRNYNEAINDLKQAITLNEGGDAMSGYHLMRCYIETGDYNKVISTGEEMTKIEPCNINIHANMMYAYAHKKEFDKATDKAINIWSMAESLDAVDIALFPLSYAPELYLKKITLQVENSPVPENWLLLRSAAYEAMHIWDKALKDLIKMENMMGDDDVNILNKKAYLYYLMGDYEDTIRDQTKLCKLRPSNPFLLFNLAKDYIYGGRIDEGLQTIESALKLENADRAVALTYQGEAMLFGKDYSRAAEYLTQAIALSPSNICYFIVQKHILC